MDQKYTIFFIYTGRNRCTCQSSIKEISRNAELPSDRSDFAGKQGAPADHTENTGCIPYPRASSIASFGVPDSTICSGVLDNENTERRKIDAFELWCWRRVLRVLWMERKTNISIIENIKPEWTLDSRVTNATLDTW